MGKTKCFEWDPERLRFLINTTNITNQAVCEGCDLSTASLRGYISGCMSPSLPNLIKMADFFCVPVDYLLGRVSYFDAEKIVENYRDTFRFLQHAAYEKYLKQCKPPRVIDKTSDVVAVWPYNLVDDIFKEYTEEPLTDDQLVGLLNALDTLTARELEVVHLYYREEKTLREIANVYNVTPERIRQILAKSLRKLRHPSRSKQIKMGARLAQTESYVRVKEIEVKKRLEEIEAYEKEIGDHPPILKPLTLEELDLSVRSYNCMARSNIRSLKQLKELAGNGGLMNIRNMGKKSILEICNKLYELTGACYHEVYGLPAPAAYEQEGA